MWNVETTLSPLTVSVQKTVAKPEVPGFEFRLLLAECHFGAAAQRGGKGVSKRHVSSDPSPPNTARARNMRFGFCSSKQIFFHSLCIYLFILFGEARKYHTNMFLPQLSWWEKNRKSRFSLRVTDAGQTFGADRLLPLIHHLLVSRLWTTTSSPAVLHAQVPSGRRFLRAMRSGETPIRPRGNPTSGLPLSQTFIYLFSTQELCFISALLIAEDIYTTDGKVFSKSLKAPKALFFPKW